MDLTSREESQRQTRERLIEAALSTVAGSGYDGTSIGAIADAAGFTKGAFFSNFESKDALLLEVLKRHHITELVELTAIMDGSSGHADVDAAMNGYVDQLVANVEWCKLSVELSLRASRDPAFAAQFMPLRQEFSACLGDLIARVFAKYGKALPLSQEHVGSLLLAFVQGISLAAAAGARRPAGSDSVNLFLSGLRAVAPPLA